MAKSAVILLLLSIGLISACATTPPIVPKPSATVNSSPNTSSAPAATTIVENTGWICFREFDNSAKELRGVFRPKGCFSSSCTLPLEQKVDVRLDDSQSAIKFITRFILVDTTIRTPEPRPCTADCGGGGTVNFSVGGVSEKNYSIWLGDRKLGSLEIPPNFPSAKGICFGEEF